jgi:hypothetical protein
VKLAALDESERAAMAKNARRLSTTQFDRNTLISNLESWLRQLRIRPKKPGQSP